MELVLKTQPPKNKRVSFRGIGLSLVAGSCLCGLIVDSTHGFETSLTVVNTFRGQVTNLVLPILYSDTDKTITNIETVLAGYEEWTVMYPQKAYISDTPVTLGALYSDILPEEQITEEIKESELSYIVDNGNYQVCVTVPHEDYAMTYLADGTFQSTPTCE